LNPARSPIIWGFFPSLGGLETLSGFGGVDRAAGIHNVGHSAGGHRVDGAGIFGSRPVLVLWRNRSRELAPHPFHRLSAALPPFQVFGAGLAPWLWLYSGYEQCSSVAEKYENPQRNFPMRWRLWCRSQSHYFLPALFSLGRAGEWDKWNKAYLPIGES